MTEVNVKLVKEIQFDGINFWCGDERIGRVGAKLVGQPIPKDVMLKEKERCLESIMTIGGEVR